MGEASVLNRVSFYAIWFGLAGALTAAMPGFGVAALLLGLLVWVRVQ